MMKIYPLKSYAKKVIRIIIFISYNYTYRKNYTKKLSFKVLKKVMYVHHKNIDENLCSQKLYAKNCTCIHIYKI